MQIKADGVEGTRSLPWWGRGWTEFGAERRRDTQVSGTGRDVRSKGWRRGSTSERRTVGFRHILPERKAPEEHFAGWAAT